ncbi:MAG: EamA family transporter RarD [Anaerolineae bacterium]|nr:EamA family transporter RarD [Anaerolineae bacterium]
MTRGTLAALSAYILWGLLPVYWKAVEHVPAQEILGHRIVWSLAVTLGLLALGRQWDWLKRAVRRRSILLPYLGSACLLGLNWFVYIWANNNGHIVETSLGYFINPLVNVLLGVVFLRERMRPWQWAAVGLAAFGVTYMAFGYGQFPWIALILAFSFGLYGLIRKTGGLEAIQGLTVETGLMFLPALGYLLYLDGCGTGAFGRMDPTTTLLLGLAGFVTAIPLILFAYGARRVPLTTMGVLQYAAPTGQFLIGVLAYGEPFTRSRLIGFSLIWAALLLYSIEGFVAQRHASDHAGPGDWKSPLPLQSRPAPTTGDHK